MNNKPPFDKSDKPRMGDPSFAQPIDILSFLVRSTLTQGVKNERKYSSNSVYQTEDKHIELPREHIMHLFNPACL